ncbi:TPA: lytic transglycosylase domain-containing protein [Escherichia coli]|nr:lytic transglycosylase domain-containing protein [Escherichia coli]
MSSLSVISYMGLCLLNASMANNIEPKLLASVILVEGGKNGTVSKNKNGSHDLGIMQINSKAWLPLVSTVFFSGNKDKAYTALKNDGCFNISVGAWILSYSIRLENGKIWEGVGRYHSNTTIYKHKYINKVKQTYDKITF